MALGEVPQAKLALQSVQALDPTFQDVGALLSSLDSPEAAAPIADDEGYESFDDFLGGDAFEAEAEAEQDAPTSSPLPPAPAPRPPGRTRPRPRSAGPPERTRNGPGANRRRNRDV